MSIAQEYGRESREDAVDYPFPTLPDLLSPGMDLVFVGINPSIYSVERGHYFARRTNRFWPAFSRSRLSAPVRRGLGVDVLGPEQDREMPRFGIGFTDVVKLPTGNVSQLPPKAFEEWAPRLRERLAPIQPRVAVFHGVMGYRPFLRFGLGIRRSPAELGPQPEMIGTTRLFVVPNPSPANAHFTVQDQTVWYDRVASFIEGLGDSMPASGSGG